MTPDEALAQMESTVVHYASHYCRGDDEMFADLCQEGRMAVVEALPRWKPEVANLVTYLSPKILGGIRHYVRDRGRTIRIPAYQQESNRRNSQGKLIGRTVGRPETLPRVIASLDLISAGEEAASEASVADFAPALIDRLGDRQEAARILAKTRLTKRMKECLAKYCQADRRALRPTEYGMAWQARTKLAQTRQRLASG